MSSLHFVLPAATLSVLLAPCAAQTVSTTLSALTPLNVQMTSGTQVASATQPAGALPFQGGIGASPVTGASAAISWSGVPAGGIFSVTNNLLANVNGPPVSGTAGPHELLLTFTLSTTAPAVVRVTRTSVVSPGQPWPTVAIDIGNNGTIDIPNVQSTATVGPLTIGPQPIVLRVILASQLLTTPTAGVSATDVEFSLEPYNNVAIVQTAIGCAPSILNYALLLDPIFLGTGVGAVVAPSPDLRAIVFGFSQQPLLLPPVLGQTCLLVPSPDVVLVAPTGMWFGVSVPLPAAVRPATLHVQEIGLSPTFGLATSNGFTVNAY